MRGFACAHHAEKRHRLDRTLTNLSKRGYIGSYHYEKDAKYRPFSAFLPEGSNTKMLYVKLVLVILMCGSLVSLLNSPSINHDDEHHTQSTAGVSRTSYDPGDVSYVSEVTLDWPKISKAVQHATGASEDGGGARVALLNFDDDEVNQWRTVLPRTAATSVRLDHVSSNVTWDHLYPEWIDEEESYGAAPTCPDLPSPSLSAAGDGEEEAAFDVVAVKLPCRRDGSWSKDVARLHLQLAAARLAANAVSRRGETATAAHVVVVSRCFPIPNLFRPRDEAAPRDGDVWLYRPDAADLRLKLSLPVGSCRLAMPLPSPPPSPPAPRRREAFATILHSEQLYACGALVLAQSIRMSGAAGARDMVALVDETISARHRAALKSAGWKVRPIRRVRNPRAESGAYNEYNYSKFWLWSLTDYDRVVFLDADLLVSLPMDHLFAMPELSAAGNHGSLFNSGVMVLEPCAATLRLLMGHVADIDSYNGGDQGYLNEVFSWWHRLPSRANFMKHFWEEDGRGRELAAARRAAIASDDPPVALAVHFVGMKPWFCFRDYDCNWNSVELRQFASDEAHARWWRAHDAMAPRELREFCLLDERQKALLRWDAGEARAGNFSDGHWRIPIADPRRRICAAAAGEVAAAACVEREIKGKRVDGNRVTTSYAKLIDNF
uniref:Hexosyltransferase n=1 Tax=Leersia perrieri TaxID=77586 RepID=A0A0D9VH26_9ORYZ